MNDILNIIGAISNVVAAICAVVAIGVTVWNLKREHAEFEKNRKEEEERKIYKEYVLDYFWKNVEQTIQKTNQQLYGMVRRENFEESELENIYETFMVVAHGWKSDAEIVRYLADTQRYRKTTKFLNDILELYGQVVNDAVKSKRVSVVFEQKIKNKCVEVRNLLLDYYKSV